MVTKLCKLALAVLAILMVLHGAAVHGQETAKTLSVVVREPGCFLSQLRRQHPLQKCLALKIGNLRLRGQQGCCSRRGPGRLALQGIGDA